MERSAIRNGTYAVVQVQIPGDHLRRAGILLVDDLDRIHVRLSEALFTADPEILEVWSLMTETILEMESLIGGHGVLAKLEETASHFLRLEFANCCSFVDPGTEADRIFNTLIVDCRDTSGDRFRELGVERYRWEQIRAVMQNVPTSPSVALRVVQSLKERNADFSQIESLISKDPAIAGQIVRLSNIAQYWRGGEIRTVRHALLQIGVDAALGFMTALVLRDLFSSPLLQKTWNEAILLSQMATHLGRLCGNGDTGEMVLLGLICNIGRIVISALPEYELRSKQVQAQGFDEFECEEILCGATHAVIGADLLQNWGFASDIVEAVRFHHRPSSTESKKSALLFLVDSYFCSSTCNLDEHRSATERLGISVGEVCNVSHEIPPGMASLRF